MALLATTGAICMCSFGSCPSVFNATPSSILCCGKPVGSVMDNVPMTNIMPFGTCTAMLGMPCIPATPTPWLLIKPAILASSKPILTIDSKLMCSLGGVIQFIVPAEFTCQ